MTNTKRHVRVNAILSFHGFVPADPLDDTQKEDIYTFLESKFPGISEYIENLEIYQDYDMED